MFDQPAEFEREPMEDQCVEPMTDAPPVDVVARLMSAFGGGTLVRRAESARPAA